MKFKREMSQRDINFAVDKIYPSVIDDKLDDEDFKSDPYIIAYEPTKKDNKIWIYIIVIVTILIILAVIIIACYNYFTNDTDDTDTSTTETNDVNANIGAMVSSSEYYSNSVNFNKKVIRRSQIILEKDEEDICDYGYYTGNPDSTTDECNFQAHAYNYYNVGKFPMSYNKKSIGKHVLSLNYDVDTGAKSRNSATTICDHTDGCVGVEYNHSTRDASLIISEIIATYPEISEVPKLDFSDNTQVYLNKKERPHFTNIVFGYYGTRQLRYYMAPTYIDKKKQSVVRFPNGIKRILNKLPYRISNYGGLIGKYYDENNNLIYTDNNIGDYNLPLNLTKYNKLFVVYTKEDNDEEEEEE